MKKGTIKKEEIVQVLCDKILKEKISNFNMVEFVKKEYGYQQSYAYQVVRDARAKIADVYKDWNIDLLQNTIADLENQKEIAMKCRNYKLVLEITKEINKISGLYIDRVEHSGSVEHKIDVIKIIAPPNGTETEGD